jgi:foldase protein PrsA
VNGAPITQAEFLRAAGQQDQALQSLIDEKLIQQEAKKQKVTVSDSEVDSEIGTIKQQLGTQQDFNAALQRANLTEPQLRDQIRTQKLAQKMGANGVTVSDDDAQTYYNQNKAQFGNQTFDQSKDQIKTQLLQQKQTEAVQTWISGLRSQAKIVIHMPA